MDRPTAPPDDEDSRPEEESLAYQQALKYGQDLARVYLAEKERRRELEEANRLLSAVFDSTPQGIVVLSPDFVIRRINRRFEILVEQPADRLVDRRIDEVLGDPDLLSALPRLPGEDAVSQLELTVQQPIRRDLLITLAQLAEETAPGWVMVVEDLSKRRQIDQQKSEFINIAAHELRTPLSSVIGYSEMLIQDLQGDLSSENQAYMDGILSGARRLNGIVEELLQFAQLSGSPLPEEGIGTYRLCDLLEDIVREAQQRASDDSVGLRVDCPSDVFVSIDGLVLRTILHQLILNGIRFNQPGGEVAIRASQGDGVLTLVVADTGSGIPRTDLEHIFDPFFQVEDSNIRQQGGLGLGLSIAQRAAALLEGSIAVDSVLGEGTTITVTLPLVTGPPDAER
jgi:two-component system phosphate regulon sensor histidine kinase PhoR